MRVAFYPGGSLRSLTGSHLVLAGVSWLLLGLPHRIFDILSISEDMALMCRDLSSHQMEAILRVV